jgi:hypothetical protein
MASELERRQDCKVHGTLLDDLKHAVFGNGRPGLKDRMMRLEVQMWVVLGLLMGNGGLLWKVLTDIAHIKAKGQ